MHEIQNKCIEINAHVADYDYEDDSLEGRITLFDEGVHLAPIYMLSDYGVVYPAPKTVDPRSSAIRFAVSRRAEQVYLHTQQRIVATVEDSALCTEMAALESQEEDAPKRILWCKPGFSRGN